MWILKISIAEKVHISANSRKKSKFSDIRVNNNVFSEKKKKKNAHFKIISQAQESANITDFQRNDSIFTQKIARLK